MKYLLALILFLLPFNFVSAHILKTDRSIGVLLHVTPEDDPIVGEPANIFVEVKDKSDKFNQADCDCSIKILSQSQEVFSSPLTEAMSYTFPQKGIYSVVISGVPRNPDQFQAFNVKYDLRVERTPGERTGSSAPLPLIIGLAAIVAAGIGFYYKKHAK